AARREGGLCLQAHENKPHQHIGLNGRAIQNGGEIPTNMNWTPFSCRVRKVATSLVCYIQFANRQDLINAFFEKCQLLSGR
ncbi:MAG: hypothetical protein ACJ73N_09965, partial [Bryobacteraceae bacterium]